MNKKVKSNIPAYFFLGFRLLEANYKRTGEGPLKSFGIKIIDSNYVKKDKIHILTTQFSMFFDEDEESTFIFNSGYHINNTNWYGELEKDQIDSLFFSVVFPYIRQKVYSLTDDIRGNVDIPIIDLRQVDLSEGIIFSRD